VNAPSTASQAFVPHGPMNQPRAGREDRRALEPEQIGEATPSCVLAQRRRGMRISALPAGMQAYRRDRPRAWARGVGARLRTEAASIEMGDRAPTSRAVLHRRARNMRLVKEEHHLFLRERDVQTNTMS